MATGENAEVEIVQRELAGGPITAEIKDGVLRARGIHYANAARFQAPLQPPSWTEPIDCTKPGAVCPQLPSRLSVVIGDVIVNRTMSEDCHFLSVTAPAAPASLLPVMVWFHGGAFASGGGDLEPYDPTDLAKRDVVVVNVNYRLGVFGYQEIPDTSPANLGLQDQIMALRWVQANISRLGGDPDRVTIFGQSAGADSCYYMLLADGVEGLFHRAILQSTPFGSHPHVKITASTLGAEAHSALKKHEQPITTEFLLDLQSDLAVKATALPNALLAFSPQLGKHPLPSEHDVQARLQTIATKIPIMIGWTAQDSLPFVQPNPSARRIQSLPLIGHTLFNQIVRYTTNTEFKRGSQDLHKLWLKHNGKSTTYSFEYYPENNPLQASHCIELAFLLGHWDYWGSTPVMSGISGPTYRKIGRSMKNTWARFAQGEDFSGRHLRITEDFWPPSTQLKVDSSLSSQAILDGS